MTENLAPIHLVSGDAQFRDPLDWEDEDGATPVGDPAPLTPRQIDDMLRAGDVAKTSLAELVISTGLSLDQVKKRRKKLGIASRDRQREAVAEANRRRAQQAEAT